MPLPIESRLTYTTTVHVRLPLLGGKSKNTSPADVPEQIAEIHRFTTGCITENFAGVRATNGQANGYSTPFEQ